MEKQNPNIMPLSETKLNKKYVISFSKYDIIRNDRLDAIQCCGTAITIKNIYNILR